VERRGDAAVAFGVLLVDADRAVSEVVLLREVADGRRLFAQALQLPKELARDKTPALGSRIDRRVRAGGVVEKTALQRVKDAVVAAIEGVDILVIAVAVVVDDRRTRMQHVAVRRGANVGTRGQAVGRRILVLLVVRATYPSNDLVAHARARVLRAPGGDRTDRGRQRGKADQRAAGTVDVDVLRR